MAAQYDSSPVETASARAESVGEIRIIMTPEMVAAGVKSAWPELNPPKIVEDQVRKIYIAMEATKHCLTGRVDP
jgi:hypothetical protein